MPPGFMSRTGDEVKRMPTEEGGKRPGYFQTLEPYFRAFRKGDLPPYSPGMPQDEKIVRAIYRIFQRADCVQRAVMTGESQLPMHERKTVRLELMAQIAEEAGMVNAHISYREEKENGETEEQAEPTNGRSF